MLCCADGTHLVGRPLRNATGAPATLRTAAGPCVLPAGPALWLEGDRVRGPLSLYAEMDVIVTDAVAARLTELRPTSELELDTVHVYTLRDGLAHRAC